MDVGKVFPWEEAMSIGFGILRLAPADFWSLTPREFEAAVWGIYGKPQRRSLPERHVLEGLLEKFPD